MCGINFSCFPSIDVSFMNDEIAHRGLPGMSKKFVHQYVQIGHVRLPIIGLDPTYDQPYETENWVFAFNGELFNYKDYDPHSESDTDTLGRFLDCDVRDPRDLKSWAKIRFFDGFWSIIALHKPSNKVYILTDFLAKKPLYIHDKSLSVSSELKAFKGLVDLTSNKRYFSQVCKFGYAANGMTPFNEIRKIPRGTIIEIDPWESEITMEQRYLDIKPRNWHPREVIEEAVKNRLVSDVPVSILVSGGIDSSIIYKLMEKHTHDFTVFHIENGESEFLDYLRIPDDIDVVQLQLKESTSINDILYANDGPVDLGSMLPQYRMAEAVSSAGLKVCITGDGADEIFGGYRRQFEYDAQYSDIFDELVYYHCPRLDKMSMYFTTELRSPFLSLPVIESGLNLPYSKRIDKNFLKEIFSDIIPKEIIERKKHPLKSEKVLSGLEWRYELVEKFQKEVILEYV